DAQASPERPEPGGDRPLPAGGAARAHRAPRALVRDAREPARRAHLPRRPRRPPRGGPDPRRRLRPARPGRLVPVALPARHREGEGRPPEGHLRRAPPPPEAAAVPAPDRRRPARGGDRLRAEAPPLP